MTSEQVMDILRERYTEDVTDSGVSHGQSWVVVNRDRISAICNFLKESSDIRMDYLIDITAVDWHPRNPRFEVVYHLHSMSNGCRLRIKVPLEEEQAVPSVSWIWRTANWHEREVFDMFGIRFDMHPDLRRILMPDEWEGHPLRKDYPLEGPDWKFKPW
ncbi:MAG TPA: NADH-quinone oxidoreductase subunit C [Nitrospirota bacterium]|jgi:NADH-quinone oxidoreductase subunit C